MVDLQEESYTTSGRESKWKGISTKCLNEFSRKLLTPIFRITRY